METERKHLSDIHSKPAKPNPSTVCDLMRVFLSSISQPTIKSPHGMCTFRSAKVPRNTPDMGKAYTTLRYAFQCYVKDMVMAEETGTTQWSRFPQLELIGIAWTPQSSAQLSRSHECRRAVGEHDAAQKAFNRMP